MRRYARMSIVSLAAAIAVSAILVGCGTSAGTIAGGTTSARAPLGHASGDLAPSSTASYASARQLVDDLALAGVQCAQYTPSSWSGAAADGGTCTLDGGPAHVSVSPTGGVSLSDWIAVQTQLCPPAGTRPPATFIPVIAGSDWIVTTSSATDQSRIAGTLHGQPSVLRCG